MAGQAGHRDSDMFFRWLRLIFLSRRVPIVPFLYRDGEKDADDRWAKCPAVSFSKIERDSFFILQLFEIKECVPMSRLSR